MKRAKDFFKQVKNMEPAAMAALVKIVVYPIALGFGFSLADLESADTVSAIVGAVQTLVVAASAVVTVVETLTALWSRSKTVPLADAEVLAETVDGVLLNEAEAKRVEPIVRRIKLNEKGGKK